MASVANGAPMSMAAVKPNSDMPSSKTGMACMISSTVIASVFTRIGRWAGPPLTEPLSSPFSFFTYSAPGGFGVSFVMPAMTLLAPPLWGALADVYQARLGLLRLTGLGSAAGCLAFLPDGGFSAALVAMAIYAGFRAPSIPLADAAAHASLGSASLRS